MSKETHIYYRNVEKESERLCLQFVTSSVFVPMLMITLEISKQSEILMISFVAAGLGRVKSHTTGTNVFFALDQQIFFFFDGYKYLSLKMLGKFTVF